MILHSTLYHMIDVTYNRYYITKKHVLHHEILPLPAPLSPCRGVGTSSHLTGPLSPSGRWAVGVSGPP